MVTTEDKLNERIKELSCLYNISSEFLKVGGVTDTLKEICFIVRDAWRFCNEAVVYLSVDDFEVLTEALPVDSIFQKCDLVIFGQIRGQISVHYNSAVHSEKSFLDDEQLLLNKVASDISSYYEQHLRDEEIALLKRRAERTDRLAILGEITAGIAHELNTPLGNILGFAELIQARASDPQTSQDIAKVIKAAIFSREIVKKLMFFSCEMPQHMQTIKIMPLVEQALAMLEPNFRKAGIVSNLTVEDPETEAQLDPIQLTQVLFNVLVNAIYVSPANSVITTKLYTDEYHIFIEIADQGPGIEPENLNKIFEPFFTTKPFGEGNGLGLSVVHGIISSHRGTITTSGNVPHGTVFKIQLPIKHQ